MSLRTRLAYLSGGIVLALGLLALLNPRLAAQLLGLGLSEPRALSSVRAGYGALLLVMGGLMLWAVPRRPRATPWLRIPALLWLAAAAGRLASIVIDGAVEAPNLGLLALELLVGVTALLGSYETPLRALGPDPAAAPRPRP